MKPKIQISKEQRRSLIRTLTMNQMRAIGWDERKESAPRIYAIWVYHENEGLLKTGKMSTIEWNSEADRRYIDDLCDFVSQHSEISLDTIAQAREEVQLAWDRLSEIARDIRASQIAPKGLATGEKIPRGKESPIITNSHM